MNANAIEATRLAAETVFYAAAAGILLLFGSLSAYNGVRILREEGAVLLEGALGDVPVGLTLVIVGVGLLYASLYGIGYRRLVGRFRRR